MLFLCHLSVWKHCYIINWLLTKFYILMLCGHFLQNCTLCVFTWTQTRTSLSQTRLYQSPATSDSNTFPWDNLFNYLLFDISIPNCFVFPCCVIVKYSYYLFLTNCNCLVNIHFFSVPTPHLPKAKKQDFRKLLHNNNYTSSTDDNRVSRWVKI